MSVIVAVSDEPGVDRVDPGSYGRSVLGSHGRSGLARVLLGSIVEAVVHRASVLVTVLR